MTLDKAIKHYKEKAEGYERQIRDEVWEPDSLSEHNCIKNAEEHRQIVEWLKELKKLREPIDEIRNSPSTQPEKRTEERTKTNACDCISREAAIDTIGNVPDHDDGMVWEALSHAQRDVALLPPVTPRPKTGRWISAKVGKLFPSNDFKCSECGNILDFNGVNCGRGDANYCPNCGARMVKSQEGEDKA